MRVDCLSESAVLSRATLTPDCPESLLVCLWRFPTKSFPRSAICFSSSSPKLGKAQCRPGDQLLQAHVCSRTSDLLGQSGQCRQEPSGPPKKCPLKPSLGMCSTFQTFKAIEPRSLNHISVKQHFRKTQKEIQLNMQCEWSPEDGGPERHSTKPRLAHQHTVGNKHVQQRWNTKAPNIVLDIRMTLVDL